MPPHPRSPCILSINGGSSTLRFAFYEADESLHTPLRLSTRGKVERFANGDVQLNVEDSTGTKLNGPGGIADCRGAVGLLMNWLEALPEFATVKAVGHRIVHGMLHTAPEFISPELLTEIERLRSFDPEHVPIELALITAIGRRQPALKQVACFDTAFHRDMPRVAKQLPIPRRYQKSGLERYGFHGLSYTYLMEELERLGDPAARHGRVILAHLGNGASMAAVRNGMSIDTSMGFTPASGIMMSTRSGDLDPGVNFYLAQTEQISAEQFQHMVNHESGLLGVSESSSDLRDLLARETDDVRAAEAVALFCYQAKKWIGSLAAALGGLDTLVFAGGIGENSPVVRARICNELGFLGIELSQSRNAENAPVISASTSRVTVHVIHTDEELMIARSVSRLLELEPMAS